MKKASTLVYSLHNLASKAIHSYQDADDLDGRENFAEVYKLLDTTEMYDIRQEVVNQLLKKVEDM